MNILLTPLEDNFTCFKLNVINFVFSPRNKTKNLMSFAYIVKVSWFKNFFKFSWVLLKMLYYVWLQKCHSVQHWGVVLFSVSDAERKTEIISLPIIFSFRNWCIFQINSVVMPGTKGKKALRLKFSSLRKKVCLGHHPISHRPWRIDQKCWTDESEMKRADERAEENRSRRRCIIYLKP